MAKVLITGAAGGFGSLTVKHLLKEGHSVVGTARDILGRNQPKVTELQNLGAKIVEMDVTDETSVFRGVEMASQLMGGIDALVNNAGLGVLGLTEAFTPEDMKKVFEVNVFGVHRVSRATIPVMQASSKGLMINISSILGRITLPFMGPYNASKWALEGLTENYRTELSQTSIEVCLVEPGGYPTTFIDHVLKPSDTSRVKRYGPMGEMAEAFMQNFEKALAAHPAQDPANVAQAIVQLVNAPHGTRPFRTIVDQMGMGGAVGEINSVHSRITEGIFGNFGMAHLLKVKAE